MPDIEILTENIDRDLHTPIPREIVQTRAESDSPFEPLIANPEDNQDQTLNEEEEKQINPEMDQLFREYYRWFHKRTETREIVKPNAQGKLWKNKL